MMMGASAQTSAKMANAAMAAAMMNSCIVVVLLETVPTFFVGNKFGST
jgi:hypothetical protein